MPKIEEETRKVWLVEHPTYRYIEDVKKLARKADLIVVDSAFASDDEVADAVSSDDAPKLTLKPEFAPAKSSKAAKADQKE